MNRSKKAGQFGRDSVSVSFDEGGLLAGLERLERRVDDALRPAARAGALVLYEEIRQRVPADTGRLKSAVYHWHDPKKSQNGREIYVVGVNKRKAPHWHLVEYGHWRVNRFAMVNGKWVPTKERLASPVWVPAKPYFRPAYDAKIGAAGEAASRRMAEKLREPDQ